MSGKKQKPVIVVDREFFASRRQVGEEFVQKLVEVFCEEAPKLIKMIKDTWKSKSLGRISELGHKLKGMSLNVGAEKLSDIGRIIEEKTNDGQIDEVEGVLNRLDDVFNQTEKELYQLLKNRD